MTRFLVIATVLALSGCGTPQEQCIAGSTRDLRVVNGLIAETEGNLQRGYAYASVIETRPQFQDCTPAPTAADPTPRHQSCWVDVPETVKKPVAIDLNAEAAKLASLRAKRTQLEQSAQAVTAECARLYP